MRGPGLTAVLGGPLGRHAQPAGWTPRAGWILALATLTWAALVARHLPCVEDGSAQYRALCYSDIVALWGPRGIDRGLLPYLQTDLEYPVLTGGLIAATRAVAGWLPFADLATTFFGLTALALFACFLGLVAVHLRLDARGAALLAGSPLVLAAGLINWDLLAVLLTSAALLAWTRNRPGFAGVLIGLGLSAKFYPALLLVPLAALCLRDRSWPALARLAAGAAGAFLAVNLPVYLLAPDGWWHQWTFHAGRGADLGSLWYVLQLAGWTLPAATLSRMLLLLGLAGVAALALAAPRRPRVTDLAFLVVALFCLVNVVYSPQYVVWLLPLLLLTRPGWLRLAAFTGAELLYWWAVWAYLDGQLYSGDGSARPYAAAVLLRLGVQAWLAASVVVDALRPAPATPQVRP